MKITDIEMFKGLSNIMLAKLLGRLDRQHLPQGETLFEQGDPGDSMYIIERGTIELFFQNNETRQSLAYLNEGDSIGEMALLTGEVRSASAVATADSVLLEIDREIFDQLTSEHPSISTYFIRLLSQRLIMTNDRLQASKETKSQWILHELEQLPDRLVHFILWCSQIPIISPMLVEHTFQLSVSEELKGSPVLTRFLSYDFQEREWFSVKSAFKSALSEMATAQYGYSKRDQWVKEAAALYRGCGDWHALIALYAEEEDWEKVHDAIRHTVENTLSDRQEEEIFRLLRRYSEAMRMGSRYASLETYVQLCLKYAPESGIAVVEEVLKQDESVFTSGQLLSVYEWGAELSRLLHNKQSALIYLQRAEAIARSLSENTSAEQDDDRVVQLAQQKLTIRKSQFFAERASRLIKPSQWSRGLAVVAALVAILIFYYIPPIAGLSHNGMVFIGIGIAAVVLWIVNIIPDYIVALGMVMLWVLGGLVSSEVALSGFASTTWLYMIFIMALSAVITKSGILYRLSLHALKRFPPHYRGQLWGIIVGGIVLNPLIPSSSAKVSLGVPIAQTLSESMGFKERSHGAAGLGLAAMIFYGFTAPFVLTGSYTNVMAYGLVSSDKPITWIEWALYAFPAFIVFAAIMVTVLSVMFRRTPSVKQVSAKVLDEQLRLLGALSREERISVCTVLGCIVLMILQPLHGIDSTWVMLLGFSVLVICGVLDRQTLTTGIDWTFLLFLGVAFSFANAAKELGIVESLTGFLNTHMSVFLSSPSIFLTAVVVLCFVVTLIVRDDPAVILLVTALLPLAETVGIHPWILVFIILLSTDPFFFSYQSPTYLTAYYSSEEKAFSHRQGQIVAIGYAAAVWLVAVGCIPYWKWLGLIH
ncbi:cyclic nucleotide-binding domain-containing protein [Paenibacillus sp. LMG 31456]|uniref:Sodium-dependent dicarboxylate transporter SdcS n=1 Tax=Paenibacillus foliorum TaxID=2654974 RepID=A0A972GPY6_9BACL|nr:SLC13 family permease [Paenibacillus foliorum]NOU94662.1 cyclic nucleotide-binding domain-containing protein [Paenibacillus foliorum]